MLSWLLVPNERPEWLTITGIVIIIVALLMYYKNSKEPANVLSGDLQT